jgi:hypothetical protein
VPFAGGGGRREEANLVTRQRVLNAKRCRLFLRTPAQVEAVSVDQLNIGDVILLSLNIADRSFKAGARG